MNRFRNRVLLKWREPRFEWSYVRRHLSWSHWLRYYYFPIATKSVLFMVILWTVVRLIKQDGGIISPLPVALGLGVSLVFCFLGWLNSVAPVEIQIREKSIVRVIATGPEFIPYKKVQSCGVRAVNLDGQRFEVLEIKDWDGRVRAFEIDPSVRSENVLARLREQGIQTLPRRSDAMRLHVG
jgi:hypothetical protein